jgi:hypothetical protein
MSKGRKKEAGRGGGRGGRKLSKNVEGWDLLSVLVHEHRAEAGQGARTKIDSLRHRCTLPTHGAKEVRLGTCGRLRRKQGARKILISPQYKKCSRTPKFPDLSTVRKANTGKNVRYFEVSHPHCDQLCN